MSSEAPGRALRDLSWTVIGFMGLASLIVWVGDQFDVNISWVYFLGGLLALAAIVEYFLERRSNERPERSS